MSWSIGWYNGWSPEERLATVPIQREAIRSGKLAKPDTCSICGARHGDDPANPVWLHDEKYDEPLTAYSICRVCHRVLHNRFDLPEPWLALIQRHGSGDRWFERLSMNPDTLRQPFTTTYPNGLPSN